MKCKSLLCLSILFLVIACKAQPPFLNPFEEYEIEDEDGEDENPVSTSIKPIKSANITNSNSTKVSAQAKQNLPKQEDVEDETEAPTRATTPRLNFGPQVASIITGALSGNLGSILSGSFNFVSNEDSRVNVNKAWESIAGITTTTTRKPFNATQKATTKGSSTTEAEDEDDEEELNRIVA